MRYFELSTNNARTRHAPTPSEEIDPSMISFPAVPLCTTGSCPGTLVRGPRRVLHAVFGEAISPIPREFLEQHSGVPCGIGIGPQVDEDDDAESDDAWVSCTSAFAPFLRLVDELVCSCAVVGENAPGSFTGEEVCRVDLRQLIEGYVLSKDGGEIHLH